jgi:hypothetical protein
MLEQLLPVLFPGIRLPTPRIARVLHVTPNLSDSFSLHSLKAVSEELRDFRVDVDTITAAQFPQSLFVNPNFLRKTYDVVFVGGTDSAHETMQELTAEIITRSFAEYHRKGETSYFSTTCVGRDRTQTLILGSTSRVRSVH